MDVFDDGLVLAETDFDSDAELEQLQLPDWIERDVSDDEQYTGGRLASSS